MRWVSPATLLATVPATLLAPRLPSSAAQPANAAMKIAAVAARIIRWNFIAL